MDKPTIKVESDYDGYFEGLVRSWVDRKAERGPEFNHARIVVSAGPYRPHAVTFRRREGVIVLDFYSALRVGFGSLPEREEEQIIELL